MNRRSGPSEALSHLRPTQRFRVKLCKYFVADHVIQPNGFSLHVVISMNDGICQCFAEGHHDGIFLFWRTATSPERLHQLVHHRGNGFNCAGDLRELTVQRFVRPSS